ncbi:hypothetical protein LSAT2_029194 [Lamellibrachia satsuma]|nr:hypothetical protein LSAT2_029194 [Lamellibrachia satsuma]
MFIATISVFVSGLNSFECSWSGFIEKESGVEFYKFVVDSVEDDDSMYEFHSVEASINSHKATGMKNGGLKHQETYYVTVTAVNKVGLTTTVFSRRLLVDNTPPQEFDMRFSAIIGKAVHGLKLLPNNKLTDANIANLREYYSHDLPSPVSMPAEVKLKKKWDSSEETKSHNLQKIICATSKFMFPNVFCMFHLLLLISVASAGEKTFNTLMH